MMDKIRNTSTHEQQVNPERNLFFNIKFRYLASLILLSEIEPSWNEKNQQRILRINRYEVLCWLQTCDGKYRTAQKTLRYFAAITTSNEGEAKRNIP